MPNRMVTSTVRRETKIRWGVERSVELHIGRETVAGVWLLPETPGPLPAALLLHGLTSHKERMSGSVGRTLLQRGVASLALDLPLHGERAEPGTRNAFNNPLALVGAWRTAEREAAAAGNWLSEQPETDRSRIAIAGYSLGGFLAIMTAASEPLFKAVLLAAAGDLPDSTPYSSIVRSIADPVRAARKLNGRHLLLVNGTRDTTTRPAQAKRLFEAASEPKTLMWYEGGHWPPAPTIDIACDWLAEQLDVAPARPRARRAG